VFLVGANDQYGGLSHPGGRRRTLLDRLNAVVPAAIHSPGAGADMCDHGVIIAGMGTILGGVKQITTGRVDGGAGDDRGPAAIFTWNPGDVDPGLIAVPLLTAACSGWRSPGNGSPRHDSAANGGSSVVAHVWFSVNRGLHPWRCVLRM